MAIFLTFLTLLTLTGFRSPDLSIRLCLLTPELPSSQKWPSTIFHNVVKKYTKIIKTYLMICWQIEIHIDAQSFSNSFEGVIEVVKKSGRGSSIFMFYCIFMLQFFKVFWGGTWGSPPPTPTPHLCASMGIRYKQQEPKTLLLIYKLISNRISRPTIAWKIWRLSSLKTSSALQHCFPRNTGRLPSSSECWQSKDSFLQL